jgi:hypothetical protein
MTCDEARLEIGAEPAAASPELAEHLRTCAACTRFHEEMLGLDADIRRALQQPPAIAAPRARRRRPLWQEWALAAGLVLAMAAGLGVWLLRPSDTLAHDVVVHVQAEPDSWLATQHVSSGEIAAALRGAGVELALTSDKITYAQSCWFRGHYVPHLVVQTVEGPATVMILRHEHVAARRAFHEDGMNGVLVPDGVGSIAVLAHRGGDLDAVAGQMQQDVRWLPQSR